MVPLDETARLLLGDARTLLARLVERLRGRADLDEAFSRWVLRDRSELDLRSAAMAAVGREGGARRSADVATLGFAVSAGLADEAVRSAFADGARWLSGTAWRTEGVPIGLADDAVALLGVAAGLAALNDDALTGAVRAWAEPFAVQTAVRDDSWEAAVARVATRLLGLDAAPSTPALTAAADVRVAFAALGLASIEAGDEQRALMLALRADGQTPALRAVTRLASLERYLDNLNVVAVGTPTVEDVVRVVRGVQRGLQEWTWEEKPRTKGGTARKWAVDHEYHVQNLLCLVLAPLFPDLRREDVTPQVGLIQPRADLGIPSLRLVVEAKFVKATGPLKSVIEEIAADRGLYFVDGSAYDRMIAVVWDDGHRTEQHEMLVRGLEALDKVCAAVVISRPGKMSRREQK